MTGMGSKLGKWIISDEDYPRFFDLMHDYLFVKRGRPMAFVEQPRRGERKPLLVDLDFRYPAETSLTRAFTLEQTRSFCQKLVDGLKIFFGVQDYQELRFFVTLRPAPYSAGNTRKDGVHILCPDIALSDEKQRVIRNWTLAQGGIEECFGGTGYTNPPTDIYDESMVRKQGWIFYGESKPNIPPYALADVYTYTPATDEWLEESLETFAPRELMELLSVRYNLVEDVNEVRTESRDEYERMKDWGSSSAGGGGGGGGALAAKDLSGGGSAQEDVGTAYGPVGGGTNAILEAIQVLYPAEVTADERSIMRRFVMECLDESFYSQYDKWIRVGWCLHNVEPSEENFQLWMDFSAKSGKAAGNNVAELRRNWFHGWRKDGDGPRLTERSLRKWARDSNPAAYKEIISAYTSEFILQEIDATHYHVAKLMRKMYGPTYIASVTKKTTEWFKYDDSINMWKLLPQGMELKMKVCSEVAEAITSAKKLLWTRISSAKEDVQKLLQEKLKEVSKVESSLYNSGFGESVMKMAVQQFFEEDFQNKLNINPFLFGCRNGVLELRVPGEDGRDHVVFRQGRPEDYVSFLAGQNLPEMEAIEYRPYDPADPVQAEITDFFEKLFPSPELRRYTLRLLASCLEGTNKEQCFYFATGVGGNGKSKLVELMKMVLGDYQTALQATVMTRKRPDSGAANPDIMAAKCRRFIYLQEPDDKEPINTSRMKQFSGEDMVEARALYGDQEKFVIMGKMFMMCNRLPPIPTMDRGTWRRIRVIEFVSKFVMPDHPEWIAKRPNVFLIDMDLDKKLRKWREPFLARLVHIYETEYIPFGLNPVPEAVMQASSKYRETHDLFGRFKGERIRSPVTSDEKLAAMEDPITTNKIKVIVKNWAKENRVGLGAEEAIQGLEAEYGKPMDGKKWPTIMVFGSDDEVLEWDASHAASAS